MKAGQIFTFLPLSGAEVELGGMMLFTPFTIFKSSYKIQSHQLKLLHIKPNTVYFLQLSLKNSEATISHLI